MCTFSESCLKCALKCSQAKTESSIFAHAGIFSSRVARAFHRCSNSPTTAGIEPGTSCSTMTTPQSLSHFTRRRYSLAGIGVDVLSLRMRVRYPATSPRISMCGEMQEHRCSCISVHMLNKIVKAHPEFPIPFCIFIITVSWC